MSVTEAKQKLHKRNSQEYKMPLGSLTIRVQKRSATSSDRDMWESIRHCRLTLSDNYSTL